MHINDMRPVQFTRRDGEVIRGHFHQWSTDPSQYEGVAVCVGVVEDIDGHILLVDAEKIQFTDR